MADVGDFLSNVLLGGLQEGQQRRQQSSDVQSKIMQLLIEEQIKRQFDPEAQFKARVFSQLNTGDTTLSNPLIRNLLGFGKSTQQIQEEEFAKRRGEIAAGPLPETPGKQITDIGAAIRLLQQGQGVSDFIQGVQKIDPQTRAFIQKQLQQLTGSSPEVAQQAVPSDGEERIIVKDRQGKRFHLPRRQLQQALRQGYQTDQ